MMNPIREFLEASNLHGLVHISKAETRWGKVLWSISVFVSFAISAILINNAFSNWSAQPVSSVISTHPIKGLKFPNVTVCPPRGSNTALNYDLVRAKNITLTEKDRNSFFLVRSRNHLREFACRIRHFRGRQSTIGEQN